MPTELFPEFVFEEFRECDTCLSLNGFMQNPVRPTINIDTGNAIPGVIPAKPYLKPSSVFAMASSYAKNSLADKEAILNIY
ncbi:MAG TPA: hypothetical protein VIL78_14510 [Hanamia sp.]